MFDIILSKLAYVKGGSLNQGHSQGRNGICEDVLEGEINQRACRATKKGALSTTPSCC